ncbi:MAG: hypothetical protein HYY05_02630, partial [Chloroflexi bacterium]|nr:hypothetical protein [Chloroflexota bacterium]
MPATTLTDVRFVYWTTTGVVRRRRKEVVALDGVSLDVAEGGLFGLLGPHGAGKPLLLRDLATGLVYGAGSFLPLPLRPRRGDRPAPGHPRGRVTGGTMARECAVATKVELLTAEDLYSLPSDQR